MEIPSRILAPALLAGIVLAAPAAASMPTEAVAPAGAEPAPAPEAGLVVDPLEEAKPAQFPGWQDEYGDCIIYCDGQPYPLSFMTYQQCCGGGHLCPDGNFPSGGNTYWSPYAGWPLLCEN